jgi:CheY-like chemotaxis protein
LIEAIGGAASAILWASLAVGLAFLFKDQIRALLGRLGSVEGFGLKFSISDQALSAAIQNIELDATLERAAPIFIPQHDRDLALERANRERARLDGTEILWVDDQPANNRNEARMLRAFGMIITFAASTGEALRALKRADQQLQPFHLILSDMDRKPPEMDPDKPPEMDPDKPPEMVAGLRMVEELRAKGVFLPVIFYISSLDLSKGVPPGAFGITNRPDQLLQLVLDALERTRR